MDLIMLYFLYVINTSILCLGFILSARRKRIYSLFWGALALLHVISFFDIDSLLVKFALSTLVGGQELMLLANFLFLIMFCVLDPVLLRNKIITVTSLSIARNNRLSERYFFLMTIQLKRFCYMFTSVFQSVPVIVFYQY